MLISDLNDTLAMVLAIGDGKALEPLTARRATAAMPFGGTYRIIDFALTNCLHSGLRRILVLTQFNALSLQNHIRDGWSIFNTDLGEFITPVTPPIARTMTTYAGVTDALHKNLYILNGAKEENVLLISGEQIYRMGLRRGPRLPRPARRRRDDRRRAGGQCASRDLSGRV